MENNSNLDNKLNYIKELLSKSNQVELLNSVLKYESNLNENNKKLIEFLYQQLFKLEEFYPGGIVEYILRAKHLINNSINNVNPYSEYIPSIPEGVNCLDIASERFNEYESKGLELIKDTGFVLVAGGLGERLGYNGIKLEIPVTLINGINYLEYYVNYIKAYKLRVEKIHNRKFIMPLCIMTSDDTHNKTIELLELNNYYNYNYIQLVKQEKVPALDINCNISFNSTTLEIHSKPHGHGDIHTLLYKHKIADKWLKDYNITQIIFFQDTNSLAPNAFLSLLASSYYNNLTYNTMTILRKPGEAVGSICKLKSPNNEITINIEYNQFESLIKQSFNKDGDIANKKTGYSYFPGNTNTIVVNLKRYCDILQITKGLVPEFVNPKYTDESKTKFKSPTRLECMLQDFPLLLSKSDKVGFTNFPNWFCFSTCKNNLNDAIIKLDNGLSPECAFSVEQKLFYCNTMILTILGLLEIKESKDKFNKTNKVNIHGREVEFGPKILISPISYVCIKDLKQYFKNKIIITKRSSIIIDSDSFEIKDIINLDGTLVIKDNNITLENNKFINYLSLKDNEGNKFEKLRGFKIE